MLVTEFNGIPKPHIGVYSFGTAAAKGLPAAQFEFDVSKFRDPVGQKQFNKAYGTNPDVREWVCRDRRMPAVVDLCLMLAEDLLKPRKKGNSEESISHWLSLGFRDFHGKWIAPAVAEEVADKLSSEGYVVYVVHHNIP